MIDSSGSPLPYRANEIKLLLLLSRSEFSTVQVTQIENLLSRPLDWHYLLEVTRRNNLVPLVYDNLSHQFLGRTDPSNYASLKQQLKGYIHRNLLLTQSMIELVNHFKKMNADLVPFKGPVLSHRAYVKPFHRYFEDLDFMVHPRDFARVCQELVQIGLVANFLNNPTYYRQAQFVAQPTKMVLDVHYSLTPVDCFLQIETAQLLSQTQSVRINRVEVKTLTVEDSLIVLCVDAAKGYWRSVIRLVDIAESIRNNQIDWDTLIQRSAQLNCQKVLQFGLFLVGTLFDAPLLLELMDDWGVKMPPSPSEGILHRQIFKLTTNRMESIRWHWFNMQALETPRATVQYLYRLSKFSLRGIPYLKHKIKT